MQKSSMSQPVLQEISCDCPETLDFYTNNEHRELRASVENQLLELKETDTRQNLEIRGLESKVSSPKKCMRLIEEELFKWESEINKASCGVAFAAKEFGSATPRHVSHVPGILPSKQESSDQRHNNTISGNQTMNISGRTFTTIKPTAKRTGSDVPPLRIAKRPRLDAASADPANTAHMTQSLISSSLETLQKSCSDLLTTERIHALFEETSELPVLTDEEKSVISKFCVNESLTETFLSVILDKMKTEKESMGHDLLQSLCRVYVGLCQIRGDSYKAHALAYRFLKEDVPEAPKLIMVMVTAWPKVFFHHSPLCKAIYIVSKMKANGTILDLLSKYLFWDEDPLDNIHNTITITLKALLEDNSLTFEKNSWYGVDLCSSVWDYILSLDLLCAQMGWIWTLKKIIRNKIWLILNTWLLQTKTEQTPYRDVSVAAVFRLLGRLGQQGLKENFPKSVQNLTRSIVNYGTEKHRKDLPWEVQLAVVYATHDLAASNPKVALKDLKSWWEDITKPVPPAVTSALYSLHE